MNSSCMRSKEEVVKQCTLIDRGGIKIFKKIPAR